MIQIGKSNAMVFSKLGQSGAAFGMGLLESMKEGRDVVVVSSDMARPAGLGRFITSYPDRFYNVGIAEQNMVGIGAGLASEGKKVIVTAQAAFVSMRSNEQVRQYLGYMKSNMVAVGIGAGFALTFFGNTHYAIEDIAVLRSIPGLTIFSPSDAGQAAKVLCAAIDLDGPSYIRFTGQLNCPVVYRDDFDFVIGKAIQLKDGDDIAIFATGSMVYNALKASEILEGQGIHAKIIDVHTIKPLDIEMINTCIGSKMLVSIEEHSIIGGLGTAISEYIASQKGFPSLLRLGVQDSFSHPGDYPYLIKQNRLAPEELAEDIQAKFNVV